MQDYIVKNLSNQVNFTAATRSGSSFIKAGLFDLLSLSFISFAATRRSDFSVVPISGTRYYPSKLNAKTQKVFSDLKKLATVHHG